jgi:regulator of CtrA degradation
MMLCGWLPQGGLPSYRDSIMSQPVAINPHILESLYCEALVLSDEVRATFALSGRLDETGREEDLARVALSCEALRTTTRMMHALAWLLNHRAFFKGERLSPVLPGGDPARLALIEPEVRSLISTTERFYARLARLDQSWCKADPVPVPGAIARLRQRLGQRAVG